VVPYNLWVSPPECGPVVLTNPPAAAGALRRRGPPTMSNPQQPEAPLHNVEIPITPRRRQVWVKRAYAGQLFDALDFLEPPEGAIVTDAAQQAQTVAQLEAQCRARGVRDHGNGLRMIALVWDTQYADDLDLHVKTDAGNHIYHGNRSEDGCELGFDMNLSGGEVNPVVAVTVRPGTFNVCVNNYTVRTRCKSVPFYVVLRETGRDDLVISASWRTRRKPGTMVHVVTHTFGANRTPRPSKKVSERREQGAAVQQQMKVIKGVYSTEPLTARKLVKDVSARLDEATLRAAGREEESAAEGAADDGAKGGQEGGG